MNDKPVKRRVRIPVTLFVETIDFRPVVEFDFTAVMTAYDLEIAEVHLRELHQEIGNHLEKHGGSKRIRVIGKLVSQ